MNTTQQLSDAFAEFYADPLGYVMFAFPWDSDPSIQLVKLAPEYRKRFNCEYGPDEWACEFLDRLGSEVKLRGFDGRTAVEPIRFSTSSGHGIGKSTLVAWLIKWIMDTRPFSKGMVTANTSDQLRTKTWAELGKWHKLSVSEHWYDYSSGRGAMSLTHKQWKERWRCDAMTCREENSEAFQGLHAAGATPFYIFDEASGIPDEIFKARSGGATDGEPMWFDFGNPTRKSGYFYENTVGKFKHRFITNNIDSRDVQITNKDLIKEWAQDYGTDSDFFKVKVRGVFPSAGSTQFIANHLVQEAQRREPVEDKTAPLVIGVDVARYGDDETVIYPRVGYDAKSWGIRKYKGLDNYAVADKVIEVLQEFDQLGKLCAGLFIDAGGLGAGVVDILRRLGYNPIEVQFGTRSSTEGYALKVDEIWGKMRDALPKLCLPDDNELYDQLTQREYGHNLAGKLRLESKDDLKKRHLPSPDIADALACTFAQDPADNYPVHMQGQQTTVKWEYDPLASKW